jgi:GTP-binding protein
VSYAPLLFISALSGKRVYKILNCAELIHSNACQRIPTPQLNEFLSWIMKNHPPISKKKQKIKIKYITQSNVLPPTFLLFTHSKTALAPSYKKFFSRLLCEEFEFWGSPVRIVMRKN